MVELDDAVMQVVKEHMPSVAGGALDCYKGEKSKVWNILGQFQTSYHFR